MTILFTPLPAPLAPGKKRRVNTKQPVITKIDYFHEDVPVRNFLTKTLSINLKCEDLFESSWLFQGEQLDDPDSFSLSYTIPHRVTDQVNITNEKDYKQMVDKATSRSPFEVKLFIIENKVCRIKFFCTLCYNAFIQTGHGEDNPEEEAEHDEAVVSRKKQKVCVHSMRFLLYIHHPKSSRPVYQPKKKLRRPKSYKSLNAITAVRISSVVRPLAMSRAQM